MPGIVLIADATESGTACWSQTAASIADLLAALPPGSVRGIGFLGTDLMWPAEAWQPAMGLPTEAAATGSFVAPVMAGLAARNLAPAWAVIVGSGEVFDLPDWLPGITDWALLRTGAALLQAVGGRVPEYGPEEGLAPLLSRLTAAAPMRPRSAEHDLTGAVKHRWMLDRAGYPMLHVPPLNAFVHLFPVAKPQFEVFLAASTGRRDQWYSAVLAGNPRLSPWSPATPNYEGYFITGLLPEDAEAYAACMGCDFHLLTVEQWRAAYTWLAGEDTSILPASVEYEMAPAARRIWQALLAVVRPHSLLDLSLMRGGVLEWVTARDGRYVALGQPRDSFDPHFRDPLRDRPWEPVTPIKRSRRFGIRLMRV